MLKPELSLDDPRIYRVSTADPLQLLRLTCTAIPHWFRRLQRARPDYGLPHSFIQDLLRIRLSFANISILIVSVLVVHILRALITYRVKTWIHQNHICPRYVEKMPESVWKLSYFSTSWLFSLFVHSCIAEINSFSDPLSIWKDWSEGIQPPIHPAVRFIYASQSAFYIHSIYATVYLDLWRKDSWLMIIHHFLTLCMMLLSYVDNFTLCGALSLLLLDNSDALLEIAKIGMYLRKRSNGVYYKFIDLTGNGAFLIFAASWVLCRLYWYPCKLLYTSIYGAVYLGPQDETFFPVLHLMLLLIYIMNIYWFTFIARMLWRVVTTGEEPEDNREFDTTAVSGLSKSSLDAMAVKKKH